MRKRGFTGLLCDKSEPGFTIIEVLVAVGLMAIVALIFSSQIKRVVFMKAATQQMVENTSVDYMGNLLFGILQDAEPSKYFISLKVNVACSSGLPCLMKYDGPHDDYVSATAPAGVGSSIQFFHNSAGDLNNHIQFYSNGAATPPAYAVGFQPLNIANSAANNLFVTWPLHGSAPALPFLATTDVKNVFTFEASTASSYKNGGQQTGILMSTDRAPTIATAQALVQKLLNSYFVVYNSYYPNNFVLLKPNSVISCLLAPTSCQQAGSPKYGTIKSATNSKLDIITASPDSYFLFKFVPLDVKDTGFAGYSAYSSGTNWPHQGITSLVPTVTPSLIPTTGGAAASDLAPGMDISMWAHFYTGIPNNIVARPVELKSFSGSSKVIGGKTIYSMNVVTYLPNSSSTFNVNDVGGKVLVARSLQTGEVRFVVQKN